MAALATAVRRIGRGALDLIFPVRCLGCGASGAFLCPACALQLQAAGGGRCDRCWRPLAAGARCLPCRIDPPAYDGLRAAFVYDALARALVLALKFQGTTALAEPMAALMANSARAHAITADVLVPVPLSGLRRRTRGYNQAEALARPLARELGLSLAGGALRRTRHTTPQARSTGAARRANVAGAFAASGEVGGRRVLLVDDVTTTGATLSACARALNEAGARSVWALAFARED